MSTATLEAVAIGNGGDLASLVLDYHGRAHTSQFISECAEEMCRAAQEVADFGPLLGG